MERFTYNQFVKTIRSLLEKKRIPPIFHQLKLRSVFNWDYIFITIEHYRLVIILVTHK